MTVQTILGEITAEPETLDNLSLALHRAGKVLSETYPETRLWKEYRVAGEQISAALQASGFYAGEWFEGIKIDPELFLHI
ncbi:MAG: hypothetical protein LUG65_07700 [Clostridiales bacterium]|nr:hypothetical protein [Clostridiales bacterium]